MKILLRKDVNRLGKIGEVVNVKNGYARNHLFPKKLAIQATEQNILEIQIATEKRKIQEAKKRKNLSVWLSIV